MKKKSSNILIVSLLNLLFVLIELIGGIITGSISILSDSIHDFGDALTLFIAYFLEKKADKKPDKKYTYGYLRYSLLGAILTAIILLIGSIFVIYNAIQRIIHPVEINYRGMIIFAIIGLAINIVGFKLTHKTKNMNEKMISLHLLEDTLSWIIVIVISGVMMFTNAVILDPILSIIISLYILLHVVKNIKQVIDIILEKVPEDIDVDFLKSELEKNFNIKEIHHVHIWSMDGENNYLTMHVVIDSNEEKENIIKLKSEIKKELYKKKINHATIEIECEDEKCHDIDCEIKVNTDGEHHH